MNLPFPSPLPRDSESGKAPSNHSQIELTPLPSESPDNSASSREHSTNPSDSDPRFTCYPFDDHLDMPLSGDPLSRHSYVNPHVLSARDMCFPACLPTSYSHSTVFESPFTSTAPPGYSLGDLGGDLFPEAEVELPPMTVEEAGVDFKVFGVLPRCFGGANYNTVEHLERIRDSWERDIVNLMVQLLLEDGAVSVGRMGRYVVLDVFFHYFRNTSFRFYAFETSKRLLRTRD